jgi:hypothetical protein
MSHRCRPHLVGSAEYNERSAPLNASLIPTDSYRAFVIGPDGLAITMHVIVADSDSEALGKATQFQGERHVELWCGSRKVADVQAIG